jgi:hypothetical protein
MTAVGTVVRPILLREDTPWLRQIISTIGCDMYVEWRRIFGISHIHADWSSVDLSELGRGRSIEEALEPPQWKPRYLDRLCHIE